ncbi:MAG: DUF1028 domain-containing protein [Planctomycetota bacterium]
MSSPPLRALFVLLFGALLAAPARATWSIVVVNRSTGEVAVATSTCLANFNIASAVPVIRVGYAAGAAQSFVLGSAANRRRIFDNSVRGATPQQLFDVIEAADGLVQSRQFGIVTFTGPALTFSGSFNGDFAGGVTGVVGPYEYAIQGNVITGNNVILDCEDAFRNTNGDLGQRIVAAMEAARDAGGDGRCSCTPTDATGCGSPPPPFTYASYNAFMAIARFGDTDGLCQGNTGCAVGDYYLRLNYVGNANTQEPIAALRDRYTTWRTGQVGRPDHVLSTVESTVPFLQADGVTRSRVTVRLRDIDDAPLTTGGQTLSVQRIKGPLTATATNFVDNGDGTHTFDLVATTNVGEGSTYAITVDDGVRPVQLYPFLTVGSAAPSELHIGQTEYSAAAGTSLPLVLDQGAANAGAAYRILGSFSGTQPGTQLGGVLVPLNRDRFFNLTLHWSGADPFTGNAGALDASGRAEAVFAPRPGALAGIVGSTISFSALVGGTSATPAASIVVGP